MTYKQSSTSHRPSEKVGQVTAAKNKKYLQSSQHNNYLRRKYYNHLQQAAAGSTNRRGFGGRLTADGLLVYSKYGENVTRGGLRRNIANKTKPPEVPVVANLAELEKREGFYDPSAIKPGPASKRPSSELPLRPGPKHPGSRAAS